MPTHPSTTQVQTSTQIVRFIKLDMQRSTMLDIFIDSDNPEDLDVFFDIVRSQVQNHVTLLAEELLKRMGCAGEIVTAVSNDTTIVPAERDDYVFPDEEYLNELGKTYLTTAVHLEYRTLDWHQSERPRCRRLHK